MGYTQETYKEATRILRERREKAERTAELHRAEVKAKCPQLAVIEQEMANTGLRAIHTVGAGKSAKETIESLAKYNLELQEQRKQLLLDNGYPENYLRPAYTCPICEDKGVDENGNDTKEPIVFSEWAFITGSQMQRCDYTFAELLAQDGAKQTSKQQSMFDAKPSEEGKFLKRYISHYRRVQENG